MFAQSHGHGKRIPWTKDCQHALKILKSKLIKASILCHQDFSKHFILDSGVSHGSIRTVLSQDIGGMERVIAYGSRIFSKSERKYCVFRKQSFILLNISHTSFMVGDFWLGQTTATCSG